MEESAFDDRFVHATKNIVDFTTAIKKFKLMGDHYPMMRKLILQP